MNLIGDVKGKVAVMVDDMIDTAGFLILALMNAPVDIEDLNIKILEGLDNDYRELARAIQARDLFLLDSDAVLLVNSSSILVLLEEA